MTGCLMLLGAGSRPVSVRRHLGRSAARHDGPVKRALWLLLPIAVMGLICCARSSPAGATTQHSGPTCAALKRAVRTGQRAPSIVGDTRSQPSTKSKSELLAPVNELLKASVALKVQLRSAPANVRISFNWVVLVDTRFMSAVKNATTPTQIRLAGRDLDSNLAKGLPFFAYVISRCEGPTPAH